MVECWTTRRLVSQGEYAFAVLLFRRIKIAFISFPLIYHMALLFLANLRWFAAAPPSSLALLNPKKLLFFFATGRCCPPLAA